MAIDPDNADIRHSLGLALVRQHNYADAIPELRQATELAPGNARSVYLLVAGFLFGQIGKVG
jgi:Flp pilus assembly protein TadD